MSDVSAVSGGIQSSIGSNPTGCVKIGAGVFGYNVKKNPNNSTRVSDQAGGFCDDQSLLKLKTAVISKHAAEIYLETSTAKTTNSSVKSNFAPGAARERVDYLNSHDMAPIEGTLINDEAVKSIISKIFPEVSDKKTLCDLTELAGKVKEKYSDAYKNALKVLRKESKSFPMIKCQMEELEVMMARLENKQEMTTPDRVREQLCWIEVAYAILIDEAYILQGDLQHLIDISLRKYIKMVATEDCPFKIVDLKDNQMTDGIESDKSTTDVINKIVVSQLEFHLDNDSEEQCEKHFNAVNKWFDSMINGFILFKGKSRIYTTISRNAAESLKSYLAGINVTRLFVPLADSGYFAAQMERSGMPVKCYHPLPKKTFIDVINLMPEDPVAAYAQTISREKGDISKAVMMFDSLWNEVIKPEGGKQDGLFWTLIKLWVDKGGKNVMIISDKVCADQLFSLENMKKTGIIMLPLGSGFSADIYQGLGEFIGVCGVYRAAKVSDGNTDMEILDKTPLIDFPGLAWLDDGQVVKPVSTLPSELNNLSGRTGVAGKVIKAGDSRAQLNQLLFFPGDFQARIDYLNELPVSGALIHDKDVLTLLGLYSQVASIDEKKKVLMGLAHIIRNRREIKELSIKRDNFQFPGKGVVEKAIKSIVFAVKYFNSVMRFLQDGEVTGNFLIYVKNESPDNGSCPLEIIPGYDINEINIQEIRRAVGLADALHTLANDIYGLLLGKVLTVSINPRKYFNLLEEGCARYEIKTLKYHKKSGRKKNERTLNVSGKLAAGGNIMIWSDFFKRVDISWCSDSAVYSFLSDAVSTIKSLRYSDPCYSSDYLSISSEAAKLLKEYLVSWSVKRVFMPMAGGGFFARQLMNAGIKASCFDYALPTKRYCPIHKMEAREAVNKVATILSGIGEDIGSTSMLLDAPPASVMDPENKSKSAAPDTPADHYFPELVSLWYQRGGRKLVVISEAAGEALLFSPERMKHFGVVLKPADPPFPVGVFEGLGRFIGVCGAYEIEKST